MSSGSEHSYPGRKVVSTRVYESAPAIPAQQEVVSTTQTEEWTTKKKTDKLITKQIKTRVKREIVVTEDGEILEDSGPLVTTDTTEETKTDEQEDVEHKTSGPVEPGPGWTLVPGSKVVHETKKVKNSSHETREEKNESEITEEIGGLTRDDITKALKQKELAAIKLRRDSSSTNDSKPKLQSSRSHKVVDTEEVDEVSEFKDGHLSTETRKKSNREEHFDGDQKPSSNYYYEDGRDPVLERVEKKVWPHLNSNVRRTGSPTTSSERSSSRNEKVYARTVPVIVESGNHRRNDSSSGSSVRSKEKEKVRTTSPSSFNSSPLQQVEESNGLSSPQHRRRRVWSEGGADLNGRNQINARTIEEEETVNRSKTFKWVENHFGSQDFEDSGIITETSTTESPPLIKEYYVPIVNESDSSTYRRVHHSKRQQMPTERKVKYKAPEPPIPPPSSNIISEKGSRPSSRSTNQTDSQYNSSISTLSINTPKKQYLLGEDPGYGQRFTGMIDACNRKSPDDRHHSDSAYSTLSLTRPQHKSHSNINISNKCSTLGRPPELRPKEREIPAVKNGNNGTGTSYYHHHHQTNGVTKNNSYNKKLNGAKSMNSILTATNIDNTVPPSATDIIHSLRSKEFLEKENSAVSIRDDDSVFDIRSVSHHPRPTTLSRIMEKPLISSSVPTSILTNSNKNRPSPKHHVVKITINSDGSECSSPVNSPVVTKNLANSNHCSSERFDFRSKNETRRSSQPTNNSGSDSIVRNAINNLMKNRTMNGSNSGSVSNLYGNPYNSLQRNSSPSKTGSSSNLTKSRVYLTASSPNVSKLVSPGPETLKREIKYKPTNGHHASRSQSINNLNSNSEDWAPQQVINANSRSNGVTRLKVDDYHSTKRNQSHKNGYQYRSNDWNEDYSRNYRNVHNYVPYSSSTQDYSPPTSPISYNNNGYHHIKLPSPVPPSRSSSSPPSSPLPSLTRPFSPSYSRDYDHNGHYHDRSRSRPLMTRTPSFNSRSPSPPPPFSVRPPSPVLPSKTKRASSLGDDASSISGRSQSTNRTESVGSRTGNSSDASRPGEKVVTTSRRKVTTTTTTKREVEHPENDYYYENEITNGTLNRNQSNNKLNGHNNIKNGNGIRFQKEYINSR